MTSAVFEALFGKYTPSFHPRLCKFENRKCLYNFTEKNYKRWVHPDAEKSKTYFREIKKKNRFFCLKFLLTNPENVRKRQQQTEGVETFH